jgi:hypothetical protein
MPTQVYFAVIFVVASIAYTIWMRNKTKQGLANARPAFQMFFERTGYRYADLEQQPLEATVERAYQEAQNPNTTGNVDLHYIRNFHGLRVHYRSKSWYEKSLNKTTYYRSNQWEADLQQMPRIPVHIADKSLDSVMKTVGEAFSNSKRHFSPKCSQKVQTGIPAIDAKYVVFGEQPDAVRYLFQQNPALVQLLQDWAELDVWITPHGACFNDPSYKNMTASMGGMVGGMAIGFDIGKRTEAGIPIHERVAELLGTLARTTA